jgi:hypothetical protein
MLFHAWTIGSPNGQRGASASPHAAATATAAVAAIHGSTASKGHRSWLLRCFHGEPLDEVQVKMQK